MAEADLLTEHLPRLYRTAWMLTGNEADAEDLAHDAMVSALASFGRFRSAARISTWLTAILINRFRSWKRAGAVRTSSQARIATDSRAQEPEPGTGIVASEERAALERALDRLGDEERMLVALSAYQGFDSTEIGRLLGRPPGTVRYQLHLAREKLREYLLENHRHEE